ncbi:hypothetical protein C7M84_011356 [Penaeus vannamei]|uniref:Uncharacterized protein n=1 Tax=Penaeus vannamei TaxID=6689 RepID=A0A423T268_PENVA|nr:hypothetical protein C7M84_011356 [Penaeus vannamei]
MDQAMDLAVALACGFGCGSGSCFAPDDGHVERWLSLSSLYHRVLLSVLSSLSLSGSESVSSLVALVVSSLSLVPARAHVSPPTCLSTSSVRRRPLSLSRPRRSSRPPSSPPEAPAAPDPPSAASSRLHSLSPLRLLLLPPLSRGLQSLVPVMLLSGFSACRVSSSVSSVSPSLSPPSLISLAWPFSSRALFALSALVSVARLSTISPLFSCSLVSRLSSSLSCRPCGGVSLPSYLSTSPRLPPPLISLSVSLSSLCFCSPRLSLVIFLHRPLFLCLVALPPVVPRCVLARSSPLVPPLPSLLPSLVSRWLSSALSCVLLSASLIIVIYSLFASSPSRLSNSPLSPLPLPPPLPPLPESPPSPALPSRPLHLSSPRLDRSVPHFPPSLRSPLIVSHVSISSLLLPHSLTFLLPPRPAGVPSLRSPSLLPSLPVFPLAWSSVPAPLSSPSPSPSTERVL